ncbi:MAG: hypothetical protein H6730_30575 [Deltaproteobacteria bacterium]|nr:hypothetical protein [Deltaproteobacteria bacterium]
MGERIYLVQPDGSLRAMEETSYDSEGLLQTLLSDHPDLLPGDQIDEREPRRWLLVSREMGIPDAPDRSDRWSVDHLFLDQDGIPTLVEVKRSSDTRIRREVVGQMLDYAANAVVHWPSERIRATFEAQTPEAEQRILALVQQADPGQIEEFWQRVETNLQAGKIRLIFVADRIPQELRRIVEFLNTQMHPAEVLAVEVRQFEGEQLRSLVPKVLGQTAAAQQRRSGPRGSPWTDEAFFAALAESAGPAALKAAQELLQWTNSWATYVWPGRGQTAGSRVPSLKIAGLGNLNVFALWTYGTVEIYFQWLRSKPPFDQEPMRHDLLRRLNEISGVNLPADGINGRPTFPLTALVDADAMTRFKAVVDWCVDEVKRAAGTP